MLDIQSRSLTCFSTSILGLVWEIGQASVVGLEKKIELDELARARSCSARLGPARRLEQARAEPIFVAREKSEPARLGSVQLVSWLMARPNNNFLQKILISINISTK
jgi:hypothetical protein